MEYKYQVLKNVEPNLLIVELNKAGSCGWKLIHVQPIQEVAKGQLQLNGLPIMKLTYQLIFEKQNDDNREKI